MPSSGKIQKREITAEMQESYLDYAMSVIVSRALPDARDGLKPVHRRILYAMHQLGLRPSSKFMKSARVVGEVLGKFHPHGDLAVYDALVRLAQPFSLRYPLIQGQGNFGSVDGDSPAAQRYTEARMAKITEELLADLDKDTVDFQANYDETLQEPKVLPTKIPQLLLNGSMGIAVGMATNIPPHNLTEIVDGLLYLLQESGAETEDLLKFVKGPDFPTGGILLQSSGLTEIYSTGKGSVTVRGQAEVVEKEILVTEIPYEVNKSDLITHIANLVEEKKLDGIRDVRDESDKDGLRIRIILKNDARGEYILRQLYRLTDLEKSFHINMLALVNGIQPQVLSLKEVMQEFLKFRLEVVIRRTKYELAKTKERIHILEGLAIALKHIDEIIATIKKAESREDAKTKLMAKFKLSAIQSEAILNTKLEALARLEQEKIFNELKEKQKLAEELEAILKDPKKTRAVVKKELEEVKENYGDKRRTEVSKVAVENGEVEEEVPSEEVLVMLSRSGYIKRMNPLLIKSQKRGGKGVVSAVASEEDAVAALLHANTRDALLFFSNRGRVFQVKVWEVGEASRTNKGKPIHNFLNLEPQEEITAVLRLDSEIKKAKKEGVNFITLVTKNGIIKKTALEEFANVRRAGLIAIKLKKGDLLSSAGVTSGEDEILLISKNGQAIRFPEKQARPLARASAGVTGMRLKTGDEIVGMGIIGKDIKNKARLLVLTANGFGKQVALGAFRVQRRSGSGIKAAKMTAKAGPLISAKIILDQAELFASSKRGQTIHIALETVPMLGRMAQGVRIMRLNEDDQLQTCATF